MVDIIRAREIIKRKYNALRRGEAEASLALERHFKPVAEPLKAILRRNDPTELLPMANVKKEEKPEPPSPKMQKTEEDEEEDEYYETFYDEDEEMQEGDENDDAGVDEPVDQHSDDGALENLDTHVDEDSGSKDSEPLEEYINANFGPVSSVYARAMITDNHDFDHTNGLRVEETNGEWMLGDKIARFDKDDKLLIGNAAFPSTEGLLELIFKREPKGYTPDDLQQYKRILDLTNAHRQHYAADKPIRATRAYKYTDIIKELYRKEPSAEDKEQRGSGIFVPLESKRTYVYWDDPNELVRRLALLASSREAGNTGLEREILSIEEELREGGYIA